jgi:plastocyanin
MSGNGRTYRLRFIAVAILGALALAAPASAGGWATVELDEPLARVQIGEPVTIGFTVLQHGETPIDFATPHLTATHRESGEEFSADGRADGEVGHYVVEVTFPTAGEWKWRITPEPFGPTSFPTVTAMTAADLAAHPDLPAVPEEEVVHPADVVRGGCGPDAALAYALTDVAPLPSQVTETDAAPVVKESETTLPVSLADLIGGTHAIAVRAGSDPESGIVACGAVLGEPLEGELVVGLAESDGSGYVGFARLSEEGGQTTVTIYLSHDLARTTPTGVPINIDEVGFSPPRLEIKAGTTIVWTNGGAIAHTVESENIDWEDSGPLHPGDTFEQTFDTPGVYNYRCGPHEFMVGTIVVV